MTEADQPAAPRRPRIVVASIRGRSTLAEVDAARLEAGADVVFVSRTQAMSQADAVRTFAGADVVAVTPKVAPVLDGPLLDALPGLRGIALFATGYDFLDVDLLRSRGVTLSVLPDYSTTSVAEHTLGLFLTMSRRIHLGNDRSRRLVPAATSLRGFELAGKVVGIIGCGRIGSTVAGYAQAFGMTVISHDIDPKPVAGVTYVGLAEVLERSDVVTLHCPMVFGDPPMLAAAELARMRRGAVLVNCSRAALVDADAVVASIRADRLRGYALDDETIGGPEVTDLLHEGRIVQTGHSAWWSDEVLVRGGQMWAQHIEALATGHPVDTVTDLASDVTTVRTADVAPVVTAPGPCVVADVASPEPARAPAR